MIQGEIQTFPFPDLVQWLALRRRVPPMTQLAVRVLELRRVEVYHPRGGRVVGEKWRLQQEVVEYLAWHHSIADAASEFRRQSGEARRPPPTAPRQVRTTASKQTG